MSCLLGVLVWAARRSAIHRGVGSELARRVPASTEHQMAEAVVDIVRSGVVLWLLWNENANRFFATN